MLPRDWAARTKATDAAIQSADAFVFETVFTPEQMDRIRLFIRQNGSLPQGLRLSNMLSHDGLNDFNRALMLTPLDPASVNRMRPWLALMVLGDYQVQNGPVRTYVEEGVDHMIEQGAKETGKPVRQLETAQRQLELLVAVTPDEDIGGFEAGLHELTEIDNTYHRLLDAWTAGDQTALHDVLSPQAAKHPDEHRLLLDARNRDWLPQIESMTLSGQTVFITIGA